MFKKIILGVLIFTTLSIQIYGSSIEELEKFKKENKNKLDDISGSVDTLKEEIFTEEEKIKEMDKELNLAEKRYINIIRQYEEAEILLLKTQLELESATEERNKQYEVLKKRLGYMYEYGNIGYVEILLGAEDVFDLFNRTEYVNQIAMYDNDLQKRLEKIEKEVEEKEKKEKLQKKEKGKLMLESKLIKENLEKKYEQKRVYLSNLRAKEDTWLKEMEDLERENKAIEKKIKEEEEKARLALERAKKNGVNIKYTGGKLLWPVPSSQKITSPYGIRTHPISKVSKKHIGIDIAASTGSNVLAAASGVVTSSSYMGGYGNTIIVNHGSGLSTLYAHNSSLVVKEGDIVLRGDIVAKIGSTGYSTGPHLHFEVRQNSNAQNPLTYFK